MTKKKSKGLFLLGIVLAFCAVFSFTFNEPIQAALTKVTLRGGTPVILRLEETIDSSVVNVGDPIDFTVARDVTVDGIIVIERNTRVEGRVASLERKGALGKGAKMRVEVRSTYAVDGQTVFLRGSVSDQGQNLVALSIILGLLCIFGFFVTGGPVQFPSGTEVKAYVDNTINIEV